MLVVMMPLMWMLPAVVVQLSDRSFDQGAQGRRDENGRRQIQHEVKFSRSKEDRKGNRGEGERGKSVGGVMEAWSPMLHAGVSDANHQRGH